MSYPVMSTSIPWSLVKSGFKKTPHFSTITQKMASGRRSTLSVMPYPTWDFAVDLNYILGGEAIAGSVLQSFLGCYMACAGSAGFFLFTDPNDNTVSQNEGVLLNVTQGAAAPMGLVGDGISQVFQLARAIGDPAGIGAVGYDIIQNAAAEFYAGGIVNTGTVSPTGVVTFDTAPPAGTPLTWDGSFQYLCQFTDDTLKDLARVSKNTNGFLWSCSSIAFESVFV